MPVIGLAPVSYTRTLELGCPTKDAFFSFPALMALAFSEGQERDTLKMDILQRVVSSTITTYRSDVDETKSSTAGAQKICAW
jgi:hypothetical protein